MSCCHVSRVTCHVSRVICHLSCHPGVTLLHSAVTSSHTWTLVDSGQWTLVDTVVWTLDTIMMSSSADHSWVLGHCTQWSRRGAVSSGSHVIFSAGPGISISISLYLGVIYANSLPPPGSSALLSPCPPHLGNLLKLAYYSAAVELLSYDIDTFQK